MVLFIIYIQLQLHQELLFGIKIELMRQSHKEKILIIILTANENNINI